MNLSKFLQSVRHATDGLKHVWQEERNFRIEIGIGLVVLFVAMVENISGARLALLTFAIGLVLMAEIMNTVVEDVTDKINKEYDAQIGAIKDMSAGFVFVASLTAAIIGLIVFGVI